MDYDTFSDLGVSDKNTNDVLWSTNSYIKKNMGDDFKTEALTTKNAIKFLLEGKLKSKVCRYCLNITQGLTELDQVMNIAGTGNLFKVTIRDIVASFHPFKVTEDPNFPNKICQKCVDRALAAYLFVQQCERAERAMLNCFDDIYEKFERLDPIDRPKKRGRQKLNPNYNKLHVEHNKVIDYAEPIINIINVGAESVTTEPPLNELECKKCWQLLPNTESLFNHEKMHPKTMWYHCRLCGKSFPKSSQLKKHNDRVHILGKEVQSHKDNNFKCKECNHTTENYILHLQHIEKHKFKKVMKHVIEKRMDKLCTVCFNKGDKMVDLDTMVCIHGGHPDLMGDKSLHSILASTLPNAKSAKYQDLYIPTNSQIMTIKKRKYNCDEQTVKKIKPISFIFSHPLFLPEYSLKSNVTYFYEFSNPIKISFGIFHMFDTNIEKVDKLNTENTNLDVAKSSETEIDVDNNKLLTSTLHSDLNNKIVFEFDHISVENTNCISHNDHGVETSSKYEFPLKHLNNNFTIETNSTLTNEYKYARTESANTEQREDVNSKNLVVSLPDPSYINKNSECNKSKAFNIHVYESDNENHKTIDVSWLFQNTSNSKTNHDGSNKVPCENLLRKKSLDSKTVCKYCWLFKNAIKCDICDKSRNKFDFDSGSKVENYQLDNITSRQVPCEVGTNNRATRLFLNIRDESKGKTDSKIWHCNICLTDNRIDRLQCICCETVRVSQSNEIRITFNNNNIFTQQSKKPKKAIEQQCVEALEKMDTCKKKTIVIEKDKTIAIEDCPMIDSHRHTAPKENTEMSSMDIEFSNTDYKDTNDTDKSKNDSEEMDIEEMSSFSIKDFNMATFVNVTSSVFNTNSPQPISNIATNLHFNIGFSESQKPSMRKFKRGRNSSRLSLQK